MLERAVTRLGWLGLLYAATLHLIHWTRIYSLPARIEVDLRSEWDQSKAQRWWQVHHPEATGRRQPVQIEAPPRMEVA